MAASHIWHVHIILNRQYSNIADFHHKQHLFFLSFPSPASLAQWMSSHNAAKSYSTEISEPQHLALNLQWLAWTCSEERCEQWQSKKRRRNKNSSQGTVKHPVFTAFSWTIKLGSFQPLSCCPSKQSRASPALPLYCTKRLPAYGCFSTNNTPLPLPWIRISQVYQHHRFDSSGSRMLLTAPTASSSMKISRVNSTEMSSVEKLLLKHST